MNEALDVVMGELAIVVQEGVDDVVRDLHPRMVIVAIVSVAWLEHQVARLFPSPYRFRLRLNGDGLPLRQSAEFGPRRAQSLQSKIVASIVGEVERTSALIGIPGQDEIEGGSAGS